MRLITFAILSLAATQAFAQSYSGGLPITVTNPSVGTNNATAPSSSTQIGYRDQNGRLQALTGNNGSIAITGTVTANQGTPNGSLTNRWPMTLVDYQGVTVTAKQLNNQVVAGDVGLVANAVIHGLTTGGGGGYVDVKVNPSGALTVDATQSGTWTSRIQDSSGSSITLGQQLAAASLPVVLASNVAVTATANGKTAVDSIRNDYSSTNVTTAAYVQVAASIAGTCNYIDVFDSSGQTLWLAFGGAGSEVNEIRIVPGGNGPLPLLIPAGTRVSLKAISATASVGEFDLNCYN